MATQLKRYIELNGKYHLADEPIFNCSNRAFLYGDALFETMVSFNGKIPFIHDHIERLVKSMDLLKMNIPVRFNEDYFQMQISKLFTKNRFYKGNRIRITVFRNEGGLYTPLSNNVSYIIDIKPIDNRVFELNEKGYVLGLFKDHYKPINKLSNIKSTNDLLFVLAGVYKNRNGIDECVLLNQNQFLCETLSSNIFLVKDGKLYTPSLESGCLNGVMRKNILKFAQNKSIQTIITPELKIDHLMKADECFITNAVSGIKWVAGIGDVRFYKKLSQDLVNELNKLIN